MKAFVCVTPSPFSPEAVSTPVLALPSAPRTQMLKPVLQTEPVYRIAAKIAAAGRRHRPASQA
jgi:hypothetical protein